MAIVIESLDAKRFLNTFDLDGQFKNRQQAADPASVALATLLYGKSKAGNTELFYINSAGVVRDLSLIPLAGTSAQGGPFTVGAVIFGNGGQNITFDAANFFYDSVNKVLTLGSGTSQSLHPTVTTNYIQDFFNSTTLSANLQVGNNTTLINTYIAEIDLGTRGVSNADKRGAVIASQLRATSAINVTADMEFYTSNAAGPVERFRIGEAGQWGIAGANFGTAGQYIRSAGIAAAPAWSTIPLTEISPKDHVTLTSLAADDHTQYALLAGRAAGQTLKGGTGVGDALKLQSTSGVGTTDFIAFLVGNNGATEAMRVNDAGRVLVGTTSDAAGNGLGLSQFMVVGAGAGNSAALVVSGGRNYAFRADVGGNFAFSDGTAGGADRWILQPDGHFRPASDNVYNLGSATFRTSNMFSLAIILGTTKKGGFTIDQDLANPFVIAKDTVAFAATGAGYGTIRLEAGTNPGTAKLVAYAGTSTTGAVILDNIGAGF